MNLGPLTGRPGVSASLSFRAFGEICGGKSRVDASYAKNPELGGLQVRTVSHRRAH